MPDIVYNKAAYRIARGEIDLEHNTIRAALLTSGYTPDSIHDRWTDVSPYEVSGAGYTSPGLAMTSVLLSEISGVCYVDADDPQWTGASFTARYMVIYDSDTNFLLCLMDFGSNKTASGSTFTYEFDPLGFMRFTK